ncbi:Decaprenyl-diphosphate synthase subunit 1 [Armadillidium vulgare]|nr:Decaprenyl-diphosphate synthase subunit 1 [Armadillidium vulgare]
MVHASSLLHDDVIDGSDIRRGKPTVHSLYSHKRVLVDLVQGEFMQLGSKEKENERFNHYLKKSFNKTASLISFSCKAVAHLANASEDIMEIAFQYGKNCGIAFQLIDDMLDFTSTATSLGKPNLNDLKSGLATAPVLFACEKFPELNSMIMRRFQEPDDVSKALEYVIKSDGLEQTKFLALKHCQEAMRQISFLKPCPEQRGLILLTNDVVNRLK